MYVAALNFVASDVVALVTIVFGVVAVSAVAARNALQMLLLL